MIIALRCLAIAGTLSALLTGTAWAESVSTESGQSPNALESPFAGRAAADDATLERATAREDVSMVAQSEQASSVSQSSVNGVTTNGEISIADNAFQNASGLTVINANTGNNVAMNASLNVNIVMTGPQ